MDALLSFINAFDPLHCFANIEISNKGDVNFPFHHACLCSHHAVNTGPFGNESLSVLSVHHVQCCRGDVCGNRDARTLAVPEISFSI